MRCGCGCGAVTPIAKKTYAAKGHVKGEHVRFAPGHYRRAGRKRPPPSPEVAEERRRRKRETEQRWRSENAEMLRARDAERFARKREQIIRQRRESGAAQRHSAARRARKPEAFVEHVDPAELLRRHEALCGICGEAVDPTNFHVDHLVPLARGGEHSYANTQPAHGPCNLRKGAKMPDEMVGV